MEGLLPVPLALKSIRPYLKVGLEVARRDPIVSYYCNFFALQSALKTNYKSSDEAKKYLFTLMDHVESQKAALKNDPDQLETLTSDIASQAVVESAAMKLFVWADSQDRASIFNKHVVKSFYTASIIFDVMEVFEESLSDEAKTHRKYARWKATYIHNCLKNNEKPVPGPVGGLTDEYIQDEATAEQPSTSHGDDQAYSGQPSIPQNYIPEISAQPKPAPRSLPSAQVSTFPSEPETTPTYQSPTPVLSGQSLHEAEKLCKFAVSALQYEDVPTAITNLEKCLRLLRAGTE